MKRIACWLILMLLFAAASALGEELPADHIVIPFEITENPHQAISARIGMAFDSEIFEFVSAQILSRDVLSLAPRTAEHQFGLLNLSGIAPGTVGTITLRVKENAPDGDYEILPVVDSVYDIRRSIVPLNVQGGVVRVEKGLPTLLEPELPEAAE